jgi:hypothetical protein
MDDGRMHHGAGGVPSNQRVYFDPCDVEAQLRTMRKED